MRLECVAVGVAEGVGEFFGRVGRVVADGLGCEIEAAGEGVGVLVGGVFGKGWGWVPDEPEETFGCGVFLRFELVQDEGLECFGFRGGG